MPLLENALRASNVPGEIYLVLSEAYEKLGRNREAEETRNLARTAGVTDPRFRLRLNPTYRGR